MENKNQSVIEREIWKHQRKIEELRAEQAQASLTDWDGSPIQKAKFPRPYMLNDPEIKKRLQANPEIPLEHNPVCRVLNALWESVDWQFNIALTQRVKEELRDEWEPGISKRERLYALVTGRAADMEFKAGISKVLAQKILQALQVATVIRMVGRTSNKAAIYAIGFWVNPNDPWHRRAVPFGANRERIQSLRQFSLQANYLKNLGNSKK
jgi:hypothetical protein